MEMNHLRDSPKYRYRTDTTFHTLVDSLEALLIHTRLTPSEIREAITLAVIHHVMRSSMISVDDAKEREIEQEAKRG